ncbi:uncharacterized protein LOC119399394 isoform X2 [Rhipicephalus sanguineus]|uniref:uncharacterized protein LOC119399394 isoform X2 n=1 Tax=Rhipicephalus sanguineus TaxID=34632 RepID=UPI001894254F|nr:uncharacterized protein LOC119399394 isoform X2 [Rhipicephalus sanguineus]
MYLYLPSSPATSNETLYLVGYSSQLYITNVECVITRYRSVRDGWVMRSVNYALHVGKEWRPKSSVIHVKWEPYAVLLNVKADEYLAHNLGAKTEYVVRNYNKHSLVLSDLKDVPSPCSLWVTRDHLDKIPKMINRTFYQQCPEPIYAPFREECFRNQ